MGLKRKRCPVLPVPHFLLLSNVRHDVAIASCKDSCSAAELNRRPRYKSAMLALWLMTALGPGCVKTPTSDLRVEIWSKEQHWQSPSKEEKGENNSAHSLLVHVFTQPGSFAAIGGRRVHVRSYLESSHRLAPHALARCDVLPRALRQIRFIVL